MSVYVAHLTLTPGRHSVAVEEIVHELKSIERRRRVLRRATIVAAGLAAVVLLALTVAIATDGRTSGSDREQRAPADLTAGASAAGAASPANLDLEKDDGLPGLNIDLYGTASESTESGSGTDAGELLYPGVLGSGSLLDHTEHSIATLGNGGLVLESPPETEELNEIDLGGLL